MGYNPGQRGERDYAPPRRSAMAETDDHSPASSKLAKLGSLTRSCQARIDSRVL
jgi:hypothetical protein